MKQEIKLQNARSVPRDTAIFIVDSFVLISSIFITRMIVLSIICKGSGYILSFELQTVLECFVG